MITKGGLALPDFDKGDCQVCVCVCMCNGLDIYLKDTLITTSVS